MGEMYVAENIIFFIVLPSPETEFNQKKKRRGPELHCNLRAKVFPPRISFVSSLDHKNLTVLGLSFCHLFLVFSNYFLFVDFFCRNFNSLTPCVVQPVFFFKNMSSPCLSTRRTPHFKPPPPRAP